LEKNLKRIKTIVVLAFIVLISLIAFCGIYLKSNGVWKNVLEKFNYGMELSGFRELHFVLDDTEEEKEVYVDKDGNIIGNVEDGQETTSDTDISLVDEDTSDATEATDATEVTEATENTEEIAQEAETEPEYTTETRVVKANEDSAINIENFELAKKIIQKRLEDFSSYEYNIRLDNVTGELVLELPDDDDLSVKESLVMSTGKIEFMDYQTGVILIDSSCVKSATTLTSTEDSQYQIYLQLKLNEEGAEKLKEISQKYVTTTDDAGEETTQYVSVKYDDQVITTTYFGEELSTGAISIPLGSATSDITEYNEAKVQADRIAKIISEEEMPLVYKLSSDNYIKADITEEMIMIAEIVFAVVVFIISIALIIKFKGKGLKSAIASVGYIAILSIIIRYTNVVLTLNSTIAFVAVVIINYIFIFKFLSELKINTNPKIAFGNTIKELYFSIVPVCIIAIIFTFMASTVINSIGMVLFWGLFIQVIYNALIILLFNII
jgi:hypothetical protein